MNPNTLFRNQHHRILSLLNELAPLLECAGRHPDLLAIDDKWAYLARWARVQLALDETARTDGAVGFDAVATMLALQAAALDSELQRHDRQWADPATRDADPAGYLADTCRLATGLRHHIGSCLSELVQRNADGATPPAHPLRRAGDPVARARRVLQ